MKFHPTTVHLKNDQSVLLRIARTEDATELRQTIQTYLQSSPHIPLTPEEFTPSVEEEVAWIRQFLDQENSLLLVAEKDDRIIGNIDLTGNQRLRMRHTGMIGMGICEAYRNTGLGTHLIRQMIQWAEENPILEILWLEVYRTNLPGRRLYERAGFQEVGTIPGFFKNESTYSDKVIMSRKV